MISHVLSDLQVHGEKGSISNTFCHAKREYSFLVRPRAVLPLFYFALW